MPKKEKLPKQKKPPKQAKHVKQQKKRKGRSVQDFIGVKTFTKYGLMTQKGELLFYLVSPTNISVLSYVWGTYGQVLTRSLYKAKAEQYPDEVGGYADFIEEHWIGGRTADCVGLIKG